MDQVTVSFKWNNNAKKKKNDQHQNLESKYKKNHWKSAPVFRNKPHTEQILEWYQTTHSSLIFSFQNTWLNIFTKVYTVISLTAEINIKHTAYFRIGIFSQQFFCVLPEL